MFDIQYTNNAGNLKTIKDAVQTGTDSFRAGDKYYHIDRAGQYPLFQVNCMGKCNTYYRTIGRYPRIFDFSSYEVWCAVAERRGFFIDEDGYEDGDRPVTHLATDQPGDEEPAAWNIMGEFTVDPAGHMSGWLKTGT